MLKITVKVNLNYCLKINVKEYISILISIAAVAGDNIARFLIYDFIFL